MKRVLGPGLPPGNQTEGGAVYADLQCHSGQSAIISRARDSTGHFPAAECWRDDEQPAGSLSGLLPAGRMRPCRASLES